MLSARPCLVSDPMIVRSELPLESLHGSSNTRRCLLFTWDRMVIFHSHTNTSNVFVLNHERPNDLEHDVIS